METTIIDRLYEENKSLVDFLEQRGESSLRSNADNHFRKVLLLSAASFFESSIKENLIQFFEGQFSDGEVIIEFIRHKAIERQYHTYFDWSRRNANSFFALFGSDFKDFMSEEIKSDPRLESAIAAFMEIGEVRNQLVHQNFAVYPIEKTMDEIYELYRSVVNFVNLFPEKLQKYVERKRIVESMTF